MFSLLPAWPSRCCAKQYSIQPRLRANSALARRCEQVVLVPLFYGRALDQQVWLVPIYRLTSDNPASEFEWLDQIPRPVSDDSWIRTNLRCWNSAEVADARGFLMVIGRFKILMTHLSGVLELVAAALPITRSCRHTSIAIPVSYHFFSKESRVTI